MYFRVYCLSCSLLFSLFFFLFFFNDTAPTEIYTLSLHDALPIFSDIARIAMRFVWLYSKGPVNTIAERLFGDRKSTRLNSSHEWISYAVFCLKKKKEKEKKQETKHED